MSSALPSPISSMYERGLSRSSTPLPPSQDPFYTAPADYEFEPPGTILRLRPAHGNLTSVTGNCSSAYNILYRTTNSQYLPSWAVTTLYMPSILSSSEPGLGTALLTYLFPYNSVDVDASPSYTFYSSSPPDISIALGLGWFVNVPDFEGPLASDAAGIVEGHATLDSVRAILSSQLGLAPDARNTLWGYSGGAIAGEWALELQEQYAPELKISGAALGGLVPNVTACFETVENTMWAFITVGGLLGVTSQYPDAYKFLVSQLKTSGPYNKTGFLSAKQMNFEKGQVAFSGQNIFDYFVNGSALLQAPIIKKVLEENMLMTYHGVPRAPLFIYKAIHDEVTLVADTDAYVERNCGVGVNILYQRNTVGGHLDEYTNGDQRALAWLGSVLDGAYAQKYETVGCTIQNVTVDIVDTGF
ncbi:hypothetical protein MMC17_009984 [Xylographa soralifera]|nr:hypothetical protein [Xylographa soralifera]